MAIARAPLKLDVPDSEQRSNNDVERARRELGVYVPFFVDVLKKCDGDDPPSLFDWMAGVEHVFLHLFGLFIDQNERKRLHVAPRIPTAIAVAAAAAPSLFWFHAHHGNLLGRS